MPRKKKTPTPVRYLSRPEVAARIGVKPDTMNRYKLPPADGQIGARMFGWLPETVDAWNAERPGRGWRKRPDDGEAGAAVPDEDTSRRNDER